MRYNLEVLNDKEFEDLCKDLLEIDLDIKLQSFKSGKDKGIDLRYSMTKENEIVVQVKHYPNSKFSDLKYHLVEIEKPKLIKLSPQPSRYIVFTSYNLNVDETDTLFLKIQPFIKSTDDIYGRKRIEDLISNNKAVEEKFYKLWLASTNILNRILHNGIKGKSEFYREKILKKIGLYVKTNDYQKALDKLDEHHFLIISGAPGMGKTSTAYILICSFLAQEFELVYIDDKLKDAEDLISNDPEKKQIFFFDDFLGSNLLDVNNPRNSESSIVNFIERLQHLKNKFLILTTRTTILNSANIVYEKFNRNGLGSISKYEVEMLSYSKLAKARILYNHLYQSHISREFYEVYLAKKNYLKVIEHKNYSPRLIEFITQMRNFAHISSVNFENFIFDNLNNPHEIWLEAYERQLEDEDRFLLTTLFTLGGYRVNKELLEIAFEARYNYEINQNNFKRKVNAFSNSLRKLLDGFMISVFDVNTKIQTFSFLNPSVTDFLLNYLKTSESEKRRILESICFTKQLLIYFHPNNKEFITLSEIELKSYFPKFQILLDKFKKIDNESIYLDLCYINLFYFKELIKDNLVLSLLNKIFEENNLFRQFDKLLFIIRNTDFPKSNQFIYENWNYFICSLLGMASGGEEIKSIVDLFDVYKKDLQSLWLNKETLESTTDAFNNTFVQLSKDYDFSQIIFDSYESHHSDSGKDKINDKLWDLYYELLDDCGLSDIPENFHEGVEFLSSYLYDEHISNLGDYDYDRENKEMSKEPYIDINREIDRLFN